MPKSPEVEAAPSLIDRASAVSSALHLDEMTLRMAARQIRSLAKAPLVSALAARLKAAKPREFTRSLTAFLNDPLGDAALSVALGGIVRYAPFVPEMYRERLSRELVIDGGAVAMSFVADIVMGPVREALAGAAGVLADPNLSAAITAGNIRVTPAESPAPSTVPVSPWGGTT